MRFFGACCRDMFTHFCIEHFPTDLRTFLSNFVATDVYALLLNPCQESFFPCREPFFLSLSKPKSEFHPWVISAELRLEILTYVVGVSDPVSSELDDAEEGASMAGVDLACRAAVLEADLVPLLEVEKAAGVAGDLHPRPPSLTALHLRPVVHLDGEAHLARLLQVAHLGKDEVETRTGNSDLSSGGEREA